MSLFATLRRYRLPLYYSAFACGAVVHCSGDVYSVGCCPAPKPSPLAPVVSTVKQPLSVTENVRKTVLENGLTVLTKEVKTAPVVSVQVWYKIGSRNEAPGGMELPTSWNICF